MKTPIQQIAAIYKPVLVFATSLLLALSLSRVLLIALHWSRVDAVAGLLLVLIQGVRFDLIIICALVLPVALLSPLLCNRPANPAKVAFSTDLLVNDLSLSSLYSLCYAIYSSSRHERSVQAYGRMQTGLVVQQVRDDMAWPAISSPPMKYPPCTCRSGYKPARLRHQHLSVRHLPQPGP